MVDNIQLKYKQLTKTVALFLITTLSATLFASCAGSDTVNQSPVNNAPAGRQTNPVVNRPTPARPTPTQAKQGLSTGQKVAILAGAAALFYLYNQHKNKKEQGAKGKYYLSKNGRVYYRDAEGRAQWVTPPPGGIRVPEEQARQYQDFQGYNGRTTGRDLTDLVPAQ